LNKFKLDREGVLKSIVSRPADYLFNNALINATGIRLAATWETVS